MNKTTVSSVSKQLLNISKRAREFSHPLDVVYTAEVVYNLAHAVGRDKTVRKRQIIGNNKLKQGFHQDFAQLGKRSLHQNS